jgi:hypothetical protein
MDEFTHDTARPGTPRAPDQLAALAAYGAAKDPRYAHLTGLDLLDD